MRYLFVRLLVPLAFLTGPAAGAAVLISDTQAARAIAAGIGISYVIVAVLTLTLWAQAQTRSRTLAAEHLSRCNERTVFVPRAALQSFALFDSWCLQNGIATSAPQPTNDTRLERDADLDPSSSSTMRVGRMVGSDAAADWARRSLLQGSLIAQALVHRLDEVSTASLLTRQQISRPALDNVSRALSVADSDRIASDVLRAMIRVGGKTLIVEDELARKSDPDLRGDLAFVEDRVLRWTAVQSDGDEGVRLMQTASSGFPLNAYVCRSTPAELGLIPQGSVTERVPDIVDAVLAIFVSAHDGETYLLLTALDPFDGSLTSVDPFDGSTGRVATRTGSPETEWLRTLIRHMGGAHDRPELSAASVQWLPTSDPELTIPLCRLIDVCDDRSARSWDLDEAASEILRRRGLDAPSALHWRWGFALSAARGNQKLDAAQRYQLLTRLSRDVPQQMDLVADLLAAEDEVELGLQTPREFEEIVEQHWAAVRPELLSRARDALGAESWLVRHA